MWFSTNASLDFWHNLTISGENREHFAALNVNNRCWDYPRTLSMTFQRPCGVSIITQMQLAQVGLELGILKNPVFGLR